MDRKASEKTNSYWSNVVGASKRVNVSVGAEPDASNWSVAQTGACNVFNLADASDQESPTLNLGGNFMGPESYEGNPVCYAHLL